MNAMTMCMCIYVLHIKSCILWRNRASKLVSVDEWQASCCFKWQPPLSVYSSEDILAWAQTNVASCLWRHSLALYIFIKREGSWDASIHDCWCGGNSGICVFMHNTPQAHTIDRAAPWSLPKASVQNQLPFSEGTPFMRVVGSTTHPFSPVSTHHKTLGLKHFGCRSQIRLWLKISTASLNTSHEFWEQTAAEGHSFQKKLCISGVPYSSG